MTFNFDYAVLSAIAGALAAVIYCLKILLSLERKIVNIDSNIAELVSKQKKK